MTTSPPAADPLHPPLAGDAGQRPVIPDHEVLRRIGRGSYGEIWLACALATGAWRAVKIVWRDHFDSERSFRREFDGMMAFEPISRSHAGFVDILQVGRHDARGFFYYIMELADDRATGHPLTDPATYAPRTLRAALHDRHRLPVDECFSLGISLAEALDALHAHGLSHRDIKPDNIIFVGGVPKLADIGLVAAHGQRSYVGTEGYVPPEGPGGVSADLYSLGKVLYESSMGRDRLDFPAVASDLGADGLGPDGARRLQRLNSVLLRACDPRPARRYGSATDLATDLGRLRSGRAPRTDRPGSRLVLVTALALVGTLVWLITSRPPHHPVAPTVRSSAPLAAVPPLPSAAPVPPLPGSVRLESDPPGAVVRLNGRELGETPLIVPDLPPGPATLDFSRPGFRPQTQPVAIVSVQTATVRAVLEKSRAPAPDARWENSLGMRFVPLDAAGVLMSDWKTRVRDFAAFVDATGYDATAGMTTLQSGDTALRGANWREPGFPQTPDHPVVGVSWKDAYAFCDWLTQREHETGWLDEDQLYRLPTDAEWSRAVGLPEEPGDTPQARSGKIKGVYPWGKQWPPPPGAGNYAGAELRAPGGDWPPTWRTVPGGYADHWTRTSPVGSFPPNALGVHDLGGNAWEWCVERFAPGGETRVLRGASWSNAASDLLLSSWRAEAFPHTRSDLHSFRVVLETPAFGRVEITSDPPGATVYQNDHPLGVTPLTLPRQPGGTAVFTVKLDGYQPAVLTARVAAGSPVKLVAALASANVPRAGQPWENDLGMRFAPVGDKLLFAVWPTRVADFERFCHETGRPVLKVDFEQGPLHPAVNVSRDDADAFCVWLTTRELAAGRLRANQRYRLPTDREWSRAAGLPDEPGDTPEARDGHIRGLYPWGKQWPPPPGAGNFADPQGLKHARKRVTPAGEPYTQTTPVGSFTPNNFGLYDMAGNVWQWCGDNYKSGGALRHWGVLRGGSWADYGPSILQGSYRNAVPATERDVIYGFRCVITLEN